MKVTHNIQSLNAIRLVNINIESFAESTGKISSGYKINSAGDNPAGLGISEIMRRQIRGLMQATNNTKDGVAFVQIADGAMDEIHSMLQRMNELTDKALNGTWSYSDRMAMNVEFDQLRTEMDRINNTTEFGTGIPVFEQHEPSYYQISGNRKWDDNQIHTVSELNNELSIHLPNGYEPSDYTITVPAGTYTTQELIDEIDTALENMTPPNPGFVFEYTDMGICKLNFERSDGAPTEIASVDGSLSYLLFDSFDGNSSSSLMGTTVFGVDSKLTIKSGENDQLGFYVESANGSNYISITIPRGDYSRSDMIKTINRLLSQQPEAAGVVAKEYEDSCIQITGGNSVSIFGLKGNMFKLDAKTASIKYSSVFYDNVQYGSSSGTAASITGTAYYNSSFTDKFHLSSANGNNVLRFKVNGSSEYTQIKFADKDGGYTLDEICKEINNQLEAKGLKDVARAYTTYNGSGYYLTLSSLLKNSSSSLEFDTTDPVAVNTYNALFCITNWLPSTTTGGNAQFIGYANLKTAFTLPNPSLTFKINNKDYTISGIGGNYTNGQDFIDKLQNNPSFNALKDKIEFLYNTSTGAIYIVALNADVQTIKVDDAQKNNTYTKLFVGTTTTTNSATYSSSAGQVTQKEGTTEKVIAKSASTSVSISDKRQNNIKITSDTNKISFSYSINNQSSGTQTITLPIGTYSIDDIAAQINNQLKSSSNSCFSSITAEYKDNKLTLTAIPNGNQAGNYYISFDKNSSAWSAIHGTTTSTNDADSRSASNPTLYTRYAISDSIKLDGNNNKLTLTLGQDPNKISSEIKIAEGNYGKDALKNAVQAAINKDSSLKGKVTVDITSDGKLRFTSSGGSITASGSFYDSVLIVQQKDENVSKTKGSYNGFQDAYIIGRKDLSTESVDIVKGSNDVLTFDFTYTDSNGVGSYVKEISTIIPEGTYTGDEIALVLKNEIQKSFNDEGLDDFTINVSIGGHITEVVGANDDTALQIEVTRNGNAEPAAGQYVIDGVRGSSAGFLFYKTTINPNATFITGTKNLFNGVTFKPGQNVLTLSVDSVPYQYTFPKNTYTSKEFVNLLNDMFENGDDNGNSAPLSASIENGSLKITHKSLGSHSITDIGGSARSAIFLEEEGRDSLDPLLIQVGAEAKQTTEIPRISVSSTALNINSITISKQKYAEKANVRIKEAINLLSSKRSIYGAIQNRLEHTINNNDIVVDRMQASESRIRDTDLSSEMVRYSNLSILLQAGQEMLAQSNEKIKKLLNLLQ